MHIQLPDNGKPVEDMTSALLSTAPEMLAVLTDIRSHLKLIRPAGMGSIAVMLNQIENVIKKAEGELK